MDGDGKEGSHFYGIVHLPPHSCTVINKARQTRFIVSHQRPLPLRPAASTVIIAFQAVTHPLLWP